VQPVAPNSPFYDETLTPTPRDLQSESALRQAGVTPPSLEPITPNQPTACRRRRSFSPWHGRGFNIQWQWRSRRRDSPAGRLPGLSERLVPRVDADGNTFQFLHTGQGNNFTGYSNPSVDGLLEQGRAMTDTGKRRVVYQQVWEALRLDLPVTYLYSPRNIVAMTAKLNGFRPVPDGMIRIRGMEMTR
jgi:peptide/nickel transport system substrate-binding protein